MSDRSNLISTLLAIALTLVAALLACYAAVMERKVSQLEASAMNSPTPLCESVVTSGAAKSGFKIMVCPIQ
jgi:histidine ammonia-lyase